MIPWLKISIIKKRIQCYDLIIHLIDHARRKIVHFNVTEHPTADEQLRDFMKEYFEYYNNERCRLAVGRDSPNGREIRDKPFKSEKIRVGLNYSSRSN